MMDFGKETYHLVMLQIMVMVSKINVKIEHVATYVYVSYTFSNYVVHVVMP